MTDRVIDTEPLKAEKDERQDSLSAADKSNVDGENQTATDVSRREILKLATGAVLAAPLVGITKAQGANKTTASSATFISDDKVVRFFTPQEFAMVDELTELIIPTDAHSPGARAAQVAEIGRAHV